MKFVAALLRIGLLELEAAQCKINLQFKVPTLVVQLEVTSEFTVYFSADHVLHASAHWQSHGPLMVPQFHCSEGQWLAGSQEANIHLP